MRETPTRRPLATEITFSTLEESYDCLPISELEPVFLGAGDAVRFVPLTGRTDGAIRLGRLEMSCQQLFMIRGGHEDKLRRLNLGQ